MYNFYGFNLCPKCHGYFRDTKIPDYIPSKQWYKYKFSIAKEKFENNNG